jgi:predicted DNA binding CopG/RHH family protein
MPSEDTTQNDKAWEEGDLGRSEKHVRRSSSEREQSVDETLGLQMIAIRMQRELIEHLKFIADYRGIGYQPLIRDVLCRWARLEMFSIAEEMQKELKAREIITASRKRA